LPSFDTSTFDIYLMALPDSYQVMKY